MRSAPPHRRSCGLDGDPRRVEGKGIGEAFGEQPACVMRTRTMVTTGTCVSGRSGSPAQRWPTDACNEEAVRRPEEATAVPQPFARASPATAPRGLGARDLAYTLASSDDGPWCNNANNYQANNWRGHAPKKIMIEAPVASPEASGPLGRLTQYKNRNVRLGGNEE